MRVAPFEILTCPHDGLPLGVRGNARVCPSGHSFDRAREGYFNLLPVGDKASLDPGDSKDMVAARRRVLSAGAFGPLADAIAVEAARHIEGDAGRQSFAILDAGCGEGYYLDALAHALAPLDGAADVRLVGIDISKWAVRAAAKRQVPASWIVASNRRPPVPDASMDLILCVFGFPIWPGFAVAQPMGGHVLLADPGPDHLIELREIIYPRVERHDVRPIADLNGYVAAGEHAVRARSRLPTAGLIADLLAMTPHAHRATAAGRAALNDRAALDVTIDVILRTFRRSEA